MWRMPPTLLLLTSLLLESAAAAAWFDFDFGKQSDSRERPPWMTRLDGGGDGGGGSIFHRGPMQSPDSTAQATFASLVQSSRSDSKQSRTEETKQEVLTQSQSSEWTRGFQDNGKGGIQSLDSSRSEDKMAGRSNKDLKASESGESSERDHRLTQVHGKTVVSADSGKRSSFSNSGQVANHTQFSSETSSSDSRLAKVILPPPPPPALAGCFGRTRASVVFLVHAPADAEAFAGALGLLEAFLGRLAPARAVLVFFNRHVLDVLDYPVADGMAGGGESGALRRRLAEAARAHRDDLADDCDLPAAAAAAERLRRQLRLASPCSLVVLAPGGVRADDRVLAEARPAAEEAQRSFDLLTAVVARGSGAGGRELESRAADLLGLFSSGGRRGLLPVAFGGAPADAAESADALGRRVCDAAEANGSRFEEPGQPVPDRGWFGP